MQYPKNELERKQMEKIPYASIIWGLVYVQTCTSPDINFTVRMLGKYQSNPGFDYCNSFFVWILENPYLTTCSWWLEEPSHEKVQNKLSLLLACWVCSMLWGNYSWIMATKLYFMAWNCWNCYQATEDLLW